MTQRVSAQPSLVTKLVSMVKWRNCMKNNLSFIPRIFSFCLVNKISLSLEKFERKPRGRARSREWWDRDVQEMSEEEFRQNFRLSRGAFNKLCQRLDPLVGKQETFARNTVSTARRVAIALYYAFFISTDSVDTPGMSAILAFSLRVAGIDCNQEGMGRESLSRIAFALALCHFLSPLRRGQVYVPFILAFLSLKQDASQPRPPLAPGLK